MVKKLLLLSLLLCVGNTFAMMFEWKHDKPAEEKHVFSHDFALSGKYADAARLSLQPELRLVNVDTIGNLNSQQKRDLDFLVQKTRLGDRVEVDRDRYNSIVSFDLSIKKCFPGKTCYVPASFKTKAKRVMTKVAIGAGILGTVGFVTGGIVGGYIETDRNNKMFEQERKNIEETVPSKIFAIEYPKIHAQKVFEEVVASDCYAETTSKSLTVWAPASKYGQQTPSKDDLKEFGEYLGKETNKFWEKERNIRIANREELWRGTDEYLDQPIISETIEFAGDGRGGIFHALESYQDSIKDYCAAKYDTPQLRERAEQEAMSIAIDTTQKALAQCIQPDSINFSWEYAGKGAGFGLISGGLGGAVYSTCFTDDLTRPEKERKIPKMFKKI